MIINLYLENKDNLLKTDNINGVNTLNIDYFRKIILNYLINQGILEIKYKIEAHKSNLTNNIRLDVIFDNDISLLRELKLKKIIND